MLKGENESHPIHNRLIPQICSYINEEDYIFIDVGANKGVISERVKLYLRNIEIIAYEPQLNCSDALKSMENNHNNFTFIDKAIGSSPGSLEFHNYENHGLSSIKPLINDMYANHNEGNALVSTNYVDVTTLDHELRDISKKIFLKIDVQGFEKEVLEGSKELFRRKQIHLVMIELMTLAKYSEDHSYVYFIDMLHAMDFVLIDLHNGFRLENGIMSEFDAVFMHKDLLKKFSEEYSC